MLVKMQSCGVNPSDKYMSLGIYGNFGKTASWPLGDKETCGVGFEGAGEVMQVGSSLDSALVGRKVAVSNTPGINGYQGTWRQYLVVEKDAWMMYPDEADYDQMAYSFINPMTVWYFWHLIKQDKVNAVIQDAACSSLGKMFLKLCIREGIKIINIVRREEQEKQLSELGAEIVLNSESEDFEQKLKDTIEDIQPKAFFDCVGGKIARSVLSNLPRYSKFYIYGSLEKESSLTLTNREVIGGRLTMRGLFLGDFLQSELR